MVPAPGVAEPALAGVREPGRQAEHDAAAVAARRRTVRARAEAAVREHLNHLCARRQRGESVTFDEIWRPALAVGALAEDREWQTEIVAACLREALAALGAQKMPGLHVATDDPMTERRQAATFSCTLLLRRRLAFTHEDVPLLIRAHEAGLLEQATNAGGILRIFDSVLSGATPDGMLRRHLEAWRTQFRTGYRENRVALMRRLRALLGEETALTGAGPEAPRHAAVITEPDRAASALLDAAAAIRRAIEDGEALPDAPPIAATALDAMPLHDQLRLFLDLARRLFSEYGPVNRGPHLAHFACAAPGFAMWRARAPGFSAAVSRLLARIGSAPDEALTDALRAAAGTPDWPRAYGPVCVAAEALELSGQAGPRLSAWFGEWFRACQRLTEAPEWGRHFERLRAEAEGPAPWVLRPGDAWSDEALTTLRSMSDAERELWLVLLRHCVLAKSRPTERWQRETAQLLEPLGTAFKATVLRWLDRVGEPGSRRRSIHGWPADLACLMDANVPALRGLLFALAHRPSSHVAAALARIATTCDRRTLHMGPLCAVARNAALAALAMFPAEVGGPYLAQTAQVLKYRASAKRSRRALAEAASKAGLSPEEFAERHVPDYGLKDGLAVLRTGRWRARLRVEGGSTRVTWLGPRGAPMPREPQARGRAADAVKAVARQAAEIGDALKAQALRLERLIALDRLWARRDWRQWYGDHPLLRHLTRRLVWTLDGDPAGAMWNGRAWHDAAGRRMRAPATVRPWHPATAGIEAIRAWRDRLIDAGICQPFKQVFREVYLLTPAEREAGDASVRFASHILRGGQLVTLMHRRGWEGSPTTIFDTHVPTPRLAMPAWGLEAHLDTTPMAEEPGDFGRFDVVVTGRIRFIRASDGRAVSLVEVPPLAFSEAMRDVDLFVSVCSVGTDPEWEHRGRFEYWGQFAHAELTPHGEAHREVIRRLLPRLSDLAGRAYLEDRYLRVDGQLRQYRIHLGSGQAFMLPNNQHLCITAAPGQPSSRITLPFEGDQTLALILSKAFLLADDDRIRDQSIARQIRGR